VKSVEEQATLGRESAIENETTLAPELKERVEIITETQTEEATKGPEAREELDQATQKSVEEQATLGRETATENETTLSPGLKETVESITETLTEEATKEPEGEVGEKETSTVVAVVMMVNGTISKIEASDVTTIKTIDQKSSESTTQSESKLIEELELTTPESVQLDQSSSLQPIAKGVEEITTSATPDEEKEITTIQILANETSTARAIGDLTTTKTAEKEELEPESRTTEREEEMTTLQIEGRNDFRESVTESTETIYSGIETTRSLKIDVTTSSSVALSSEEETTLVPETRNEMSSETIETETATSSPMLDLTTTKLILIQESDNVLVVHTTTAEAEMTTVGYRIQESIEGKETTTSKTLEEEEGPKEFVMVEDEKEAKEAAGRNQTLHTLKCFPTSNVASEPGTIPMQCQDTATSIEPIIVVISAEGLDLDSISKKNIKIVVKEFMLMEMQQSQAPRRK
jgi:hypothetical protein